MTVERLLQLGADLGWPAVRLASADTLNAGEQAWRRYLTHLTADQHARLVEAIEAGWATGPGGRGLVRTP